MADPSVEWLLEKQAELLEAVASHLWYAGEEDAAEKLNRAAAFLRGKNKPND